jgi:hypothetical protein
VLFDGNLPDIDWTVALLDDKMELTAVYDGLG